MELSRTAGCGLSTSGRQSAQGIGGQSIAERGKYWLSYGPADSHLRPGSENKKANKAFRELECLPRVS
jgi:hypothetical protein